MAREFCHSVFCDGFRLCPLAAADEAMVDTSAPSVVTPRLRGVAARALSGPPGVAADTGWCDSRRCRGFLCCDVSDEAVCSGENAVTLAGADAGVIDACRLIACWFW
jgi:hypothetical protein